MMTKLELRCYFRKARQDFVSQHNSEEIIALLEDVKSHLDTVTPNVTAVAGYAAMTSEIDLALILDRWREQGRCIALPWFESRSTPMEFRECNGDMARGPFGIRQPPADAARIDPELMLVPLVAADLKGNRIGQGKGHYDRYLENIRAKRDVIVVGLAWECQIAETIPADPWDQRLDYICTPERIIRTST